MVALVRDLMFASRIRGSAPAAQTATSVAALLEVAGARTRLVLVDAEVPDGVSAVREVRRASPNAEVVGFGPHVDEAALAALTEAGADRVLPRGRFVRELPQLVRSATA